MHIKVPDKEQAFTVNSDCSPSSTGDYQSHRHSNLSEPSRRACAADPPVHESGVNTMTSRSDQFHSIPSSNPNSTSVSASVGCHIKENKVIETDSSLLVWQKRTISCAPITGITTFNNSLSMEEGSTSSHIHAAGETKVNLPDNCKPIPRVRQRLSKNSSTVSLVSLAKMNQVPTPSTPDGTDANKKLRRFPHAFKRIAHVVVCASLCIVFISSSGKGMHVIMRDKRFATLQNRRNDGGNNLRKKPRPKVIDSQDNQRPVPDNELEMTSTNDSLDHESQSAEGSEDQSGDDAPNNGDGGHGGHGGHGGNPNTTDNSGSESFQNAGLRDGENEVKKQIDPTLAYAQSHSSLQMLGAPNLKNDRDPVIYHNDINSMTDTGERSWNSEVRDEGTVPKKKRRPKLAEAKSLLHFQMTNILPVSKQTESSRFKDGHFSKNHNSYQITGKSLAFWYGDTTNQIIICVAWFFIVIFMMEAAREMKRRYRLQHLRRFLDYSMQLTSSAAIIRGSPH